ncbi:tumor necrosis factor receptor superfamily member 14 isoform X4 [Chanodichthys erythropterus]|uniref:tumor necrosis factor receptor superfamily member 14 isoform X4 n=1 Tax=Chanodichthys erythropterus TaxID=933992 RepID=UPI00351DCA2A
MCIYYNLSILLFMRVVLCMAACNNAEYEINGECCPMCDSGKKVHKHCDDNTSTTCESCLVMTYTDTPNGLTKCLPCLICDASNGLRVKQECTLISNTACEPLPGYHCIDLHSNCPKAKKHSTCSPGQYVNQTELPGSTSEHASVLADAVHMNEGLTGVERHKGTEFSDTVCDDCPAGSYSNGTICKLHTNLFPY